ncbi:hypothetical protein BSKO_00374 [Bryopsis sp. KO-2023]|nr:hypothetical protein BSKO_00374 [Bryopsis sp. KO-2023]
MVSQGKGEEIVMRDFITIPAGAPICARRFLDLFKRGGDDDMFSSYFTEKEMQDVLQHMAPVPCLVLMSGKDKYVPQSIDTRVLGERISQAIGPNAISRVIEGGLHSLNGNEDEAVSVLTEFIKSLDSTPEMNGS